MIGIVDYNMGNLASVKNAFKLLGEEAVVESDPEKFGHYDKLILPGVGAFGDAMEHLKERSMDEALREYAKAAGIFLVSVWVCSCHWWSSPEMYSDTKMPTRQSSIPIPNILSSI